MTEKQFETVLAALADKIKAHEETIALQKWQIETLEKKLSEAECHFDPLGKKPKTLEIR